MKVYGGTKHGVVGCDIYQTGQGGVHLEGGDRKTLTPAGHYADNNHIHHTARWDPVYQQAITVFGVGNRATHNLIHNVPHVAIGFTGNDQTIEYNEIHSAVFQSNDAGAIYTSPPDETWSMRGHKIRYNYLHNIHGFEGKGCLGVYLDDCFSSADISGNVFYDVATAILIGGGRDNLMTNNMFINCGQAFSIDARGLGWAKGVGDFRDQGADRPELQAAALVGPVSRAAEHPGGRAAGPQGQRRGPQRLLGRQVGLDRAQGPALRQVRGQPRGRRPALRRQAARRISASPRTRRPGSSASGPSRWTRSASTRATTGPPGRLSLPLPEPRPRPSRPSRRRLRRSGLALRPSQSRSFSVVGLCLLLTCASPSTLAPHQVSRNV